MTDSVVSYHKYSPENETITVKSMNSVQGLFDVFLKCLSVVDIGPFINYLGDKHFKENLHLYINHFDPNWIVRNLIKRTLMKPLIIPRPLRGVIQENSMPKEFDDSVSQLILLETAGYSRWDEVAYIMSNHNISKDVLTATKRAFMNDHNIPITIK